MGQDPHSASPGKLLEGAAKETLILGTLLGREHLEHPGLGLLPKPHEVIHPRPHRGALGKQVARLPVEIGHEAQQPALGRLIQPKGLHKVVAAGQAQDSRLLPSDLADPRTLGLGKELVGLFVQRRKGLLKLLAPLPTRGIVLAAIAAPGGRFRLLGDLVQRLLLRGAEPEILLNRPTP